MSPNDLIAVVMDGAPLAGDPVHGDRHWRAVAATGLRLAERVPDADREVVVLFGLLHDARRVSNGLDPGHGARAARLAGELRPVTGDRLDLLIDACGRHCGEWAAEEGRVLPEGPDLDATIGVCFDADRLGLPRVGRSVDPWFLSTHAAMDPDLAAWAATLHEDPPTWQALFAQVAP